MSKEAIVSLAVLKVNWEKERRSFTDNFAPLVAECLRTSAQPVVSLPEVQARVFTDFGLRVPGAALSTVLGRLEKQGYLRREHNAYLPNRAKLDGLKLAETRARVAKYHEATLANLVQFCKERYEVEWTIEDAENALLSYLKEHDLDILKAVTEGTPIPRVGRSIKNALFLVNSFARHVHENDPESFAYLETMVKGYMLANALVFPDVSAVNRRFRRTQVYLDTRIVINALGYNGDYRRATARDLLDLLYAEGAEICCFRHTYDEVYGILDGVSRRIAARKPSEGYGGVARTFQEMRYSEGDVLMCMNRLEGDLERLRTRVVEKPVHGGEFQIDEPRLDRLLEQTIPYKDARPRARDVDSLSAIFRLRQGQDRPIIEECGAIFVTTNRLLVQASRGFFNEYQSPESAPVCISDGQLTNILWLKSPMTAPELPRKQIIAQAYAAMEPPPELWSKYISEIEKLQKRGDINAEDYLMLRSSIEARALLMETTMGDPDAIDDATVEEILETVKESIKDEARQETLKEQAKRQVVEEELTRRDRRIEEIARRWGTVVRVALLVVAIVLLGIATYSSFEWDLPGYLAPSRWPRLLLTGIWLGLWMFGIYEFFWGSGVEDRLRRIELWSVEWCRKILQRWLGVARSSPARSSDAGDKS